MEAKIRFDGDITPEDSQNLRELGRLIESECDVSGCDEESISHPGGKGGGLLIGIGIATLAAASIDAFLSALTYWNSKKSKYSISVTLGDVTQTIENMDFKRYQQEYRRLKDVHGGKIDVYVKKR